MKYRRLIVLTIILILLTAGTASGYEYKDRNDFRDIFDDVARNYGAVENAFYTFGIEFERVPVSLEEMFETSHLAVEMINPYTGEPLKQTFKREIGDIGWELDSEDPFVSITAFYGDFDDPGSRRWMTKTIIIYTHEELHNVVFLDDAPRQEIMVRVYCLQLEDAIESFVQRFGRLPQDIEDLATGDVNVAFINPITGERMVSTSDLSPGDFWYQKLDEEHYAIIGWGYSEEVYFLSNDRSIEDSCEIMDIGSS